MNCSEEIGGFYGLELPSTRQMLHSRAIRLNTGRNCLRYVIRAYGIKKIFVSYFTCPVIWESAEAEGCRVEYYSIDNYFMPIRIFPADSFILYANYFGVCARNVAALSLQYPNLIIDNAQAFYMPPTGIASFYSPRKFFGVPDGGLLYSLKELPTAFPQGESYHRCSHLLKRLDLSAQAAYVDFRANDEAVGHEPIQIMSKLTERILQSIDYDSIRLKRLENFEVLHTHLRGSNELDIQLREDDVPLAYPFICENKSLRQQLIDAKIYIPKYWPGIENYCPLGSVDLALQRDILPIPCDQRYSHPEMNSICKIIKSFLHHICS